MANANWSNPTLTSTYTNFVPEVKNRDEDCATQFASFTGSNQVTGTIKWDSTANRWKKWDGSAWAELASTYALTALSTTGAAALGGNLTVTGSIDATSSVSGTAFIPDGTTVPANGMYRSAANQLAFATNTNARITIASDGDVGISTTSPTQKLDVNGGIKAKGGTSGDVGYTFNSNDTDGGMFSPADDKLEFRTNNTTRLTISSTRIGIGVTAPDELLHVHNASQNPTTIKLSNTEGSVFIHSDGAEAIYDGTGHRFRNASGSTIARLDTANTRLGIGIASPTDTLHVNGTAKATTFSGSGASLTSLNASNISSGTIAAARVPTLNQNTTGNATTATKLATARNIGGVSFNGESNINLPGVNQAGNQNTSGSSASCTGNAATATDLAINVSNRLIVQTANNATEGLASGSAGQVLKSNGSSLPTWHDLGNLGGVKGFIAFTGSNGSAFRSSNLTVSRSGTGVYTVTLDSSIRTGDTNYGVVIGNVDEGRLTETTHSVTDNWQNVWLDSRGTTSFVLKAIEYHPYTHGLGGDDEDRTYTFNRDECDPDVISLIVF